jgi:hypothetical protein
MSKGVIIIEQTGILTLVGAIAVILALIAFGNSITFPIPGFSKTTPMVASTAFGPFRLS